jgi:integrase
MKTKDKAIKTTFPTCTALKKAIQDANKKEKYTSGQKALTGDQINKLLLQITDLEHLGLFQLVISTGIRREDLVKIKKLDIDLQNQSVTFYEAKKRRIKTVFIPTTVSNTLQMMLNINKKEPFLFPGGSERLRGSGFGHMSGRNAYNIFQHYLEKAGLSHRPFHSLRASCIKLCQRRGWSVEQTAELVGDKISTIQESYLTPSTEEMKEVVGGKPIL